MDEVLTDHFRCPEFVAPTSAAVLSRDAGYFTFRGVVCYGRCAGVSPARRVTERLPEVADAAEWKDGCLQLPFDLTEVVTNLRREYYTQDSESWLQRLTSSALVRQAYYAIRPVLSVSTRKHMQKLRLSDWSRIPFPKWPVDTSTDRLLHETLRLVLERSAVPEVPFVWFWPGDATACVMMTHDVEGPAGHAFSRDLMTMDEAFGIRSSFQIIPEMKVPGSDDLIAEIRRRGFEVNVHDLSHDGTLFSDRASFLEKAALINGYGRQMAARGFRSGAMYRQQAWFDALDFSYDMSVPNGAHLEPQRGGCCTVMPYFVGQMVELPLTTTQDYSLFHILGDYSTTLWKQQIEIIVANHGLVSFITHPDYLVAERERRVYEQLLVHLAELRESRNIWFALPGDIDRWWRSRREMTLVRCGEEWRIEGPGSDRARVAFASLDRGRVAFRTA